MVGKGERAGARSWAANEAGALLLCPCQSVSGNRGREG